MLPSQSVAFIQSLQGTEADERELSATTPKRYFAATKLIDAFIDGRTVEWDWDDFVSVRKDDVFLESARKQWRRVDEEYPSKELKHYCSAECVAMFRPRNVVEGPTV